MRTERLYLADIIEAADAIERFLTGIDRDVFDTDDLRQSAILQKLTIIGEAAARLPDEFRGRHREIEWRDIVAFRNIAVHEYFAVDWTIVWVSATHDVPTLRTQIAIILANEDDEPRGTAGPQQT